MGSSCSRCSKADGAVHAEYIRHEVLGSGAFSTVYRATNRSTGDEVALKMIPNAIFAKNKEATLKEVEVLKRLRSHPNIVRLYDVIPTKQNFTIAMELCRGEELFTRICEKEFYTEESARKVILQALNGIQYLHSERIAHRDLKPENMIFQNPSEDSALKITDFGFASFYDPSNPFVKTCGTPLYVAPEILAQKPYSWQCDIWSLGVVVYVMLCGYPPFYADTDTGLFAAIQDADYEFHKDSWEEVSSSAKDFISKCFLVDPEKRLTATEALEHPWITSIAKDDVRLGHAQLELKRLMCKRKLIKGINAVIAANRIKRVDKQFHKR